MVTKVSIKDNEKSSIMYISDLDNFQNGMEYVFKPGINIIIGENGSGKTTLLRLVKDYLLVDEQMCGRGKFNNRINNLVKDLLGSRGMCDGVDVYADYMLNTFCLQHLDEMNNDSIEHGEDLMRFVDSHHSSTGESVLISIDSLWRKMFSNGTPLVFDYGQFADQYKSYFDYVQNHKVITERRFTVMMDEPDRNLSISKIDEIYGILSHERDDTQMIAVIHNPLLIYRLSKLPYVNFIEMTEGYKDMIVTYIDNMVSGKKLPGKKNVKRKTGRETSKHSKNI